MRTQQGQTVYLKDYREPDYWVKTVDLSFDLHPERTLVHSQLLLERNKNTSAGTAIDLDGDELELLAISIDGKELASEDYSASRSGLKIHSVPKKRRFIVEIHTEINPAANTKLMGLYRSGGNFCTQCEAEGFRRITYFPDRPDVLATYTTRIEADKKDCPILLGNGNPVKKGAAGKGRHYAVWEDPHPKPSYLFALVAGNLGSIHKAFKTKSGRKVKLGIYVEKGKEERARYAMDSLVRSMRWDEEVFGCEYDLDVFNIVAVSDFNMGAMENKGLNIFNDKYVLADADTATDADYANIEAIIAHEYFHNWTGNRITCRDWFQLCLKEGLTVYRDQEFSSDERSRPVKRITDVKRLKASQFAEDAGPLAHPVRPATYNEINNFYTATVYEKGAELVRMIATILGEKKFRKGMSLYLKRHDGDAATIEDFIACFEKAGNQNLDQFTRWYSQAGTPHIDISPTYDKTKARFTLEFDQVIPPTPGQSRKAPHHIPQRIGLIGKDGADLSPSSVSGADFDDGVLHLKKRNHRVVFSGISERPVVSLNRGFSAPVEINFRQSVSDLAFLAEYDNDEFGQWQAHQAYGSRLLIAATKNFSKKNKPEVDERFLEITAKLTGDETLEPAFRALILQLPGEGELAQLIGKNVDPDAIAQAVSLYSRKLGKTLAPLRQELLAQCRTTGKFSPDADNAGKRSLLAAVNRLGAAANDTKALRDIEELYHSADNMTDRFNAFLAIVHEFKDKATVSKFLADFYERYKDNHIVLDKWFAVQASRPGGSTVSTVRKLMTHKDFSYSNPNRLRSLIGIFAMSNATGFNAESGKGYELVGDVIIKLDKINPQVAARLLTAFRSFRTMESARRAKAERVLRKISSQESLSPDVSDIVSRTLS